MIANVLVYILILLGLSNLIVSLKSLDTKLTEILCKIDNWCDNLVADRIRKDPLDVVRFEDSGYKIVYCPSLDVAGYGRTDEEAEESFRITFEETLEYINERKESNMK